MRTYILKRAAALALVFTVLLSLSLPLSAAETCGESLTWRYDKGTKTLIIEGSGEMTSWHNNRLVPWKSIREEVLHISFPKGLTSVGDYAFYGFKNLREIDLPSTVRSIGNGSFSVCESLTSVTLPKGVTDLGGWVFASCTSLSSISFPTTLKTINYECFLNCPKLMDVKIPSSVTTISGLAFGYGRSHSYNYNMILRGVPGSVVQSYADSNKLRFVSIYSGNAINYSIADLAVGALTEEENASFEIADADFNGDGIVSAKDSLLYKAVQMNSADNSTNN